MINRNLSCVKSASKKIIFLKDSSNEKHASWNTVIESKALSTYRPAQTWSWGKKGPRFLRLTRDPKLWCVCLKRKWLVISTLLITLSVYVVIEVQVSCVTCRCHNLIRDHFPYKLPLVVNYVRELWSSAFSSSFDLRGGREWKNCFESAVTEWYTTPTLFAPSHCLIHSHSARHTSSHIL